MKKMICSIIATVMCVTMLVMPVSAADDKPVRVIAKYLDGYTTITMTVAEGYTVRYTTDGSKPNSKSTLYSGETIKTTDDIRLRTLVVAPDSTEERHSYYIDVKFETLEALEKSGRLDNLSPEEDYTSRYSYRFLDEAQKEWVRHLYIYNTYGIRYDGPTLTDEEHEEVCNVFFSANPWHMINDHNKAHQRKIKKVVNNIVSAALKKKTDYDTIKYIHDSICDIYSYESGSSFWTDAILEGEANCVAYSDAFTYMCQMAGYDCITVDGEALNWWDGTKRGGHAWNLVKIGGKWYYTDVTWDDSDNEYTYFLIGSKNDSFIHTHLVDDDVEYLYPTVSKTDYKSREP